MVFKSLLAAAFFSACITAHAAPDQPNILFLFAEHMTEHTAFADFLCENTQNTQNNWNTYFCEKDWEKGKYPNATRSEPGDYIREHMFYVLHVFLSAHR